MLLPIVLYTDELLYDCFVKYSYTIVSVLDSSKVSTFLKVCIVYYTYCIQTMHFRASVQFQNTQIERFLSLPYKIYRNISITIPILFYVWFVITPQCYQLCVRDLRNSFRFVYVSFLINILVFFFDSFPIYKSMYTPILSTLLIY